MTEPVDEFDTLSPEELARLTGNAMAHEFNPDSASELDTIVPEAVASHLDDAGTEVTPGRMLSANERVGETTSRDDVTPDDVTPDDVTPHDVTPHDSTPRNATPGDGSDDEANDLAGAAAGASRRVRQSTFVEAAMERRFRRRRSAVIVGIGGFLVLALLGMTFGKNSVENGIRQRVTKTLSNDYRNVKVDVDGTQVSLSGSVASDQDLEEVTQLVENTNLVGSVDTKQLVVRASSGIGLLPLRATYNEGSLTLQGTSPGDVAVDAMLKQARSGLGESKVVNQFTTGTTSDKTPDVAAYESLGEAFSSFSRLGVRSAEVTVDDRGVTVEGTLRDEASRAQLVGLLRRAAGSLPFDDRMVAENQGSGAGLPGATTAVGPGSTVASTTTVSATPEAVSAAQADLNELLVNRRIEFSTDSSTLSNQAKAIIQEVADVVIPLGVNIEVGGHTDGRGKAEKNLALSQRRADAVRTELIRLGVPEARVAAVGYGSQKLIARDDATRGNPKNRRIEITLK